MIAHINITLELYGERFSPNNFSTLTGVIFDNVVERDVTLMPSGRYKGRLSPYGCGKIRLQVHTGTDYNVALTSLLLDFYQKTHLYPTDVNVTTRTLWLTITFNQDGQMGFEITPDNTSLIGKLGLTMAVNIDQSA